MASRFDVQSSASSSAAPVVAVSDSGVAYVLWEAVGQVKASPSPELPQLPPEFAAGRAPDPDCSIVPGVTVRRQGTWSKAGILANGPNICIPSFAWCEGEKLNLLVRDGFGGPASRTHHLVFDPASRKWTRRAVLPYCLSRAAAFCRVGEAVHVAFTVATDLGPEFGSGRSMCALRVL